MNRNKMAAMEKAILDIAYRCKNLTLRHYEAPSEFKKMLQSEGFEFCFPKLQKGDRVIYVDIPDDNLSPGTIKKTDPENDHLFYVEWDETDEGDDWFEDGQLRLATNQDEKEWSNKREAQKV